MAVVRTGILLAAMTALFGAVGLLIGGEVGLVIALVLAAGMNVFAWWSSDQMVLRMHNARQVNRQTAPQLVRMVEQLARRAEMPMPAPYVIDSEQPNAFATGRSPDHAAVAATTGLLRALSEDEIAGVMAHELAHIKNRDTLTMTITATLAGAITLLANFAFLFRMGNDREGPGLVGTLALMFLAPLAAGIVQMAISRTREYEADKLGAEICGQPMWLASALLKIEQLARGRIMTTAEQNPATAHMFIHNPLAGLGADNLFSTHPATENRVAALREMSNSRGAVSSQVTRAGRSAIPRSGRRKPSGPWR